MILEEKHDQFTVYKQDKSFQFQYILINEETFFDSFADYILDFDMLKKHTLVNIGLEKKISLTEYNEIYNRLIHFVDYEKIIEVVDFDEAIINILNKELINENTDIRKDKWGRIGEYVFNIILDTYFELDCIVRKFSLQTSRNMSVYGIDTVHCSLRAKKFFFGESKTVNSIDNGIDLINKSLENYESQISDEYFTMKNNHFNRNKQFLDVFEDSMNRCFSFDELIHRVNIQTIAIPIFIAHAEENFDPEHIFKKFERISTKKLFNLETEYIFISLPLKNKEKFRKAFIDAVKRKIEECKECIRHL